MPSLDGIPFKAGEPGPNAPPHMWFTHYQARIAELEERLLAFEHKQAHESPMPHTEWPDTPVELEGHELAELRHEYNKLEDRFNEMREKKNDLIVQRTYLVALLARIYPSGIRPTDIPGWNPEWHNCCYIDLPTGQISYHYHVSQADLFKNLPPYSGDWDGSDQTVARSRISNLFGSPGYPATDVHSGAELTKLIAPFIAIPPPDQSPPPIVTFRSSLEIAFLRAKIGRMRGTPPEKV